MTGIPKSAFICPKCKTGDAILDLGFMYCQNPKCKHTFTYDLMAAAEGMICYLEIVQWLSHEEIEKIMELMPRAFKDYKERNW